MMKDFGFKRFRSKLSLSSLVSFVSLFLLCNVSSVFSNPTRAPTNVTGFATGVSSITWRWTQVAPESLDVFAPGSTSGTPLFTLSSEHIRYEVFSTTGSSYVDSDRGLLHYTSGKISPRLPSTAVSFDQKDLIGPNTSFSVVVISTICDDCIAASFLPDFSSVAEPAVAVTSGAQNPTFQIGISSVGVFWDSTTYVSPLGNYYLVKIATSVSGSTSTLTASTESWNINRSSTVFVNLSTNTLYTFEVDWATGPNATINQTRIIYQGVSVGGSAIRSATYTLAVVPPTPPSATATGFISGLLSISSAATNPSYTQYAILSELPDNPQSVHHNKYIPAISGGVSDLDNISDTPVGQTFAQWNNGSNIPLRNTIGGTSYNFHVAAMNGDGILSSTSPPVSMATFPSGPKVRSKTTLPSGSWINQLITTFTVSNSVHYHSTFTANSADFTTLDAVSNFGSFSSSNAYTAHLSSQVVIVTATASGPWYFTSFGDSFGYQSDPTHTRLAVNQFQINIDTTPSNLSSLSGQFSSTDTAVIVSSETTGRPSPYFQWTFSRNNTDLESPATGYSYVFSTDINSIVDEVVDTTSTAVFFSSPTRLDGTYYFKVKAKDTAGNWGAISTFTYIYAADSTRPTLSASAVTSATGSDGRFLGVSVRPTIGVTFSERMKSNTVTSTNNIVLSGVVDNSGNSQNTATSISLSYSTTTRVLSVTPDADLNKGWLYQLVITTNVKDTGENALLSPTTVQFQTIMDIDSQNIVKSTDGTKGTLPAGALPSGKNLSIPPPSFVTAQTLSSANTKLRELVGSFAQPIAIRQFLAVNSNNEAYTGSFNSPVTIVIPYADTDGDGIVDGTSPPIRVKSLSVYVLDETNNVWQKVSNATIDTSAKTATFQANHFSYYSIFGAPDNDVNGAYAYPVPFKPGSGHTSITFTNLPTDGSIRIYTSAGELVKEIKFNITSGASTYVWDVKDEDGQMLGSDVYLYVIESGPNKKRGKLVIIR